MSAILPYVGLNEVKDEWKDCIKALLAELLGTMFLVLLACGACMQVSTVSPRVIHSDRERMYCIV